MNGSQFDTGLAKLRHGERLAYHSGNLMRDRQFNVDVDSVAIAASKAADDKRCVLMQRKVSEQVYQYLAIRIKKR